MTDLLNLLLAERIKLRVRAMGVQAEMRALDEEIERVQQQDEGARSSTGSERPTFNRKVAGSSPAAPAKETPSVPEANGDGAAAASETIDTSAEDMSPPPAVDPIGSQLEAKNDELPDLAEAKDRSRPDDLTPAEYRLWQYFAGAISSSKGVCPTTEEAAEALGLMSGTIKAYRKGLQDKGYMHVTGWARGSRWHVDKWPDGIQPCETKAAGGGAYATRTPDGEPRAARRFTDKPKLDPEKVKGLPEDHIAVVEGRTLFPSTVVDADDAPRLLVSGQNSPKLGSHVTKGPWKGMPIFSLTLEERATCPRSCHVYSACYGNGMPQARRHKHGPVLVEVLGRELRTLASTHPDGFVVRLHQLGDFYDNAYVVAWWGWLEAYENLRIFGYTAHAPDSKIGAAVDELNRQYPDRCAIRFSSDKPQPHGATTIDYMPDGPAVPEGVVCPAQIDRTDCCGTCGLCWHPNFWHRTIVFIKHGQQFGGRPPAAVPKAKGAYEPKRRPSLKAVVSMASDYVEDTTKAGYDIDKPFEKPMQRRCLNPQCQRIFKCRSLRETLCPDCLAPRNQQVGGQPA